MKRKVASAVLATMPLVVALIILYRGSVEKPPPQKHAHPESSQPALRIKKMEPVVKQPVRPEEQPPKPKHLPDD